MNADKKVRCARRRRGNGAANGMKTHQGNDPRKSLDRSADVDHGDDGNQSPYKGLLSFWVLAAVLFFFSMFLGCGYGTGQSSSNPPKEGGVLYLGIETPVYGLDVLGAGSGGVLLPDMVMLNNLIQEPLFRMDQSGNLIPVLGVSASLSKDAQTWVIKLRKGIRFHDGTSFSSKDVVHHWGRMLDPDNNFRGRKLFEPIQGVEAVDEYTVHFLLAHPWAAFLKVISDEQYLSSFIPSSTAVDAGAHGRKPVGTGPFRYYSWNHADHYVVIKNTDYWQKGKPLLNKVVFRTIPDHQTRYASLKAGELDAVVLDRGRLIKKALKDKSIYLHTSESNGAEIVMLNTRVPPLDDIRVRRALALANNQALHVGMIYGDAIPFIHHPFGGWFPCKEDRYPVHDMEAARRLIQDYGKPVNIECLHSNTSRGRQTGALLQQLYKRIGVGLEPVGLSSGAVVMKALKRDYQMTTWRILAANDLGAQLYRTLHSQSPSNYSGYRGAEMDRLLQAQRIEMDPTKRAAILCEIAALINTDVPFFYRGGRRYNIVARKKIRDLTNMGGNKVNLATAWLDETVKFNTLAFDIERKAVVPEIDCPDPGDVQSIKARIAGQWHGTDDWGGALQLRFNNDDKVVGTRSGGYNLSGRYMVCGTTITWRAATGAKLVLRLSENKLEGTFKKGAYGGTILLEKAD